MNRQKKPAPQRKRFAWLAPLLGMLTLAVVLFSVPKLTETSEPAQHNGAARGPPSDAPSSSGLTLAGQRPVPPSPTGTRSAALLSRAANIDYEGFTSYGLYTNQGKHKQARPYSEKVLALVEKVRGPNHPDVAAACNNIAEVYRYLGDTLQAKQYSQRALAILEEVYGSHSLQAIPPLTALAAIHQKEQAPP